MASKDGSKKENTKKEQAAKGKSAPAPKDGEAKAAGKKKERKEKAAAPAAAAGAPAAATTAPAAANAAAPAKQEKKQQKGEQKQKAAAATPAAGAPAAAGAKKSAGKKDGAPAKKTPSKKEQAAAAAAIDFKAPHMQKIKKGARGELPTELEQLVARTLFELEVSSKDLTAELADLYFVSAKAVEVPGSKTAPAIVVFVPFKQHTKYKKVHARLVRELEKKLSRHVVIIAQRTILSKTYSRANNGQPRPRSRTLTAVHNSILDDLVFPTLIVGKRLRVRADGSRVIKVHLDPKDTKEMEGKLKTFQTVYKRLTNKTVEFIFPLADD